MKCAVSVIIPTFNRATFLPYAVDSVLVQTRQPTEIIVIDDVSTDETTRMMSERYGINPLIRYLQLPKNRGAGLAREMGVRNSRGDFIAFLDSDDVWLPDHLHIAVQSFEAHPKMVAVVTQRGQIDSRGTIITQIIPESFSGDILDLLLKRVIFHPSRLVVQKQTWIELLTEPPGNEALPYFVEDYYYSVCLLHQYGNRILVLPNRTVWMRAHPNQSYQNAQLLKDSLLEVVDQIFAALPDLLPLKTKTRAANLFHASYFLWRAGEWTEAWRTLWEGIRSYPQGVGLRDFWISVSRLLLPPRFRKRLTRNG